MIGIYKITNLKTGQCYIGQSKNLEKREYQHFHSCGQSLIDKEILKDPKNFKFEILEECNTDELIEKETFYISKTGAAETGYNCAIGGCSRPGEKNSNSKVQLEDVEFIRKSYAQHASKREVYEKVKDRLTWRGFEKIWNNETWKGIMEDVYSDENKHYYMYDVKSVPQEKTFSDEEVLEFRKRYVNETGRQIYNSINGSERCVYDTFEYALIGMTYTHLPIYKKKDKIWINN